MDASTIKYLAFFKVISYLKILRVAKVIEATKRLNVTVANNKIKKKKLEDSLNVRKQNEINKGRINKQQLKNDINIPDKYIVELTKYKGELDVFRAKESSNIFKAKIQNQLKNRNRKNAISKFFNPITFLNNLTKNKFNFLDEVKDPALVPEKVAVLPASSKNMTPLDKRRKTFFEKLVKRKETIFLNKSKLVHIDSMSSCSVLNNEQSMCKLMEARSRRKSYNSPIVSLPSRTKTINTLNQAKNKTIEDANESPLKLKKLLINDNIISIFELKSDNLHETHENTEDEMRARLKRLSVDDKCFLPRVNNISILDKNEKSGKPRRKSYFENAKSNSSLLTLHKNKSILKTINLEDNIREESESDRSIEKEMERIELPVNRESNNFNYKGNLLKCSTKVAHSMINRSNSLEASASKKTMAFKRSSLHANPNNQLDEHVNENVIILKEKTDSRNVIQNLFEKRNSSSHKNSRKNLIFSNILQQPKENKLSINDKDVQIKSPFISSAANLDTIDNLLITAEKKTTPQKHIKRTIDHSVDSNCLLNDLNDNPNSIKNHEDQAIFMDDLVQVVSLPRDVARDLDDLNADRNSHSIIDLDEIDYNYVEGLEDEGIQCNYKVNKRIEKLLIEKSLSKSLTLKMVMLIMTIIIGLQITNTSYIDVVFGIQDETDKIEYCIDSIAKSIENAIMFNKQEKEKGSLATNYYINQLNITLELCFYNLIPLVDDHNISFHRVLSSDTIYPDDTIAAPLPRINVTGVLSDNDISELETFDFMLVNLRNCREYIELVNMYPLNLTYPLMSSNLRYANNHGLTLNVDYYFGFKILKENETFIEYYADIGYLSFLERLMNILRSAFVTAILIIVSHYLTKDIKAHIIAPVTNIIKKLRSFFTKSSYDFLDMYLDDENSEEEAILYKKLGIISYYFDLSSGKRVLGLILGASKVLSLSDFVMPPFNKEAGFKVMGTILLINFKYAPATEIQKYAKQINKLYTVIHSMAYTYKGELVNENIMLWKSENSKFEKDCKNYFVKLSKSLITNLMSK